MVYYDPYGRPMPAPEPAPWELNSITRLNSIIHEEEKNIDGLYRQIGSIYMAKHLTDAEEDFSGMIRAIQDAQQRVVACQKRVLELKGLVACPKCGAELPIHATFCRVCGTSLQQPAAQNPNQVHCSRCGAVVEKGMRFCTACGQPIAPAPEAVAAPAPASERTCPQCGAPVEGHFEFCTKCGTKIAS